MSSFLRRKLALMLSTLSTSFNEWFGYPLICNGSSAGYLTDYKLYGNIEQKYITVDGVQYKVPDGYTVLDYIQATGTGQAAESIYYIDTGIAGSLDTEIEADITHVFSGTSLLTPVASNKSSTGGIVLSHYASGPAWATKFGNISFANQGNVTSGTKYHIVFNKDNFTVDGTAHSVGATSFTDTSNIYLMCDVWSSAVPTTISLRMGTTIIRKSSGNVFVGVPMKNSSNVIGFYDFITNTFFTNQGTGTFTAGNEAPCPTQPLDILSVGDKTDNLFDGQLERAQHSSSTGVKTSSTVWVSSVNKIPVTPNTAYSINAWGNDTSKVVKTYIFAWYQDGSFKGTIAGDATVPQIFTVASDVYYIDFQFAYSDRSTTDINTFNCSIVEGSTAPSSYIPYGYAIPVVSSGLNLFDKTAVTSGYYLNSTGTLVSASDWNISDYMPVSGEETYYQKLKLAGNAPRTCWYDKDKTFISSVTQVAGGTQTAPSNACYCRMCVYNREGATTDLSTAMFTEGSTAPTSYVAYVTPVTTDIYLDNPLRAVSTYKDYIDYGNQNVVSKIGVKVFDGTETFVSSGILDDCWTCTPRVITVTTFTDRTVYCTHFKHSSTLPASSARQGYCLLGKVTGDTSYSAGGYIGFGATTDYPTLAEFQAFLASEYAKGTPVTCYYYTYSETTTSATLPQLPTFATYTKITTDTTVKPSDAYGKQ